MSEEQAPVEPEVFKGFGREGVAKDENVAQSGTEAEHSWGVQYQGPFESATDGSARAVRLHAKALDAAGVPVLLQSFSNSFLGPDGVRIGSESMDEGIKRDTHALRHRSIRELRLRVKHMVVGSAEQLRSYIIPNYVAIERDIERAIAMRDRLYKTTIVYSVWERSTIDPAIAAILQRVGECWVPCEENKALLQRHGIERVTVVPHPWEITSDMAKLTRRSAITEKKRFYAIGLWQPRKHFHETIGAFLLAFKPGDSASLTIKHRYVKLPGYPSPVESVGHWLSDPAVRAQGWHEQNLSQQLWLPGGNWTEDEILKLHYESNIYVCASRGEAYCLPAFDAKVAGNRMILVGYGGVRDFSSAGDQLIPYEMMPVPKEYAWEEHAMWAEASVKDIAQAMLSVQAPMEFVRGPAMQERSLERVGQLMKERATAVLERAIL